ncbi:hypothetical protein [Bradyrhizobium genosp. A]|uniref:hypothetical protein n=1 Tax=Bradyrhizobium genosp. A TaxID=83626 RepID=UPI003CEBC103
MAAVSAVNEATANLADAPAGPALLSGGRPISNRLRWAVHRLISGLALRDQLRALGRRQIAADQLFVDFERHQTDG